MRVGFFNWAAPIFHRADRRWTDDHVAAIAEWLRPATPPGGSLLDVSGGTGALAARLGAALGARRFLGEVR
jgi:ubiquinone/menaquinone biosynthesis C-methylase UbiE